MTPSYIWDPSSVKRKSQPKERRRPKKSFDQGRAGPELVEGMRSHLGLKLKFYTDDEGRCIARFRPKPEHQGYPGQLHGGLISSLLDVPI